MFRRHYFQIYGGLPISTMKWWSNPKQRQRWHSSQILPSDTDNWGQIFFDLFFVGGAYNLGNVLKTSNSLNGRTLLYFLATGFPSMVMWHDKLYFDARFTNRPGWDLFHRTLEILQLCCVATALSRIRSVEVESHPCNHIDIFEFALALFLNSAINIVRYVEVVNFVEGDPGARVVAKRDILCRILPALFLLAAAIESGMSSWSINGDHDEECAANETPIWYCLASWISGLVIGYINQILFAPKVGQRKLIEETSVPLNVHFCMHRYGEWFMLMFGESIMSLVIVEGNNESWNHNLKFYAGILSVTFLAQLHFKSEPGHGEDHALSRSRWSNYLYTAWLVPIYSLALISTGICYKMFLYNYSVPTGNYDQEDTNYDNRRNLGGGNNGYGYGADSYGNGAGDGGVNGNTYYEQLEENEQDTANLFGRSLALVFICTDLNLLLHHGRQAIWDQFGFISRTRIVSLFFCKAALLIFLITMSYLQNDPHFMAIFGLGAILFQDILRRTFRKWQQEKENITSGRDNDDIPHIDSADSDIDNFNKTPTQYNTLEKDKVKYSDDENYQYDIERFETAEAALAKFEQEPSEVIEGVEKSSPTRISVRDLDSNLSPSKLLKWRNSNILEDSYCQLSE